MSLKTKSVFYFKYATKTVLYFFISAYVLNNLLELAIPGSTTSPAALATFFFLIPIWAIMFFVSMYIAYKVVKNEKKGLFFLVLDTAQYFLGFAIILMVLFGFSLNSN